MSTPVAGSLATVPLHVAAGDIAVWWNDPGGTWESVPLGSGPAGPQGVPGPAGATGPQGVPGPPGATGATGSAGVAGPVGPTGATGPAGSANMSGMVAGQIPIAASATSVASSIPQSTFLTPATAAATYAPINAPVFTGDARAVTPATADNDTSIATTAYVQAQGYTTSASMTAADNLRVLKAGDTMSGTLNSTAFTALSATTSASYGPQILLTNQSADTTAPYLTLQKGRAGGTTTLNGDGLGNLEFNGYGSGNAIALGAYIAAVSTGAAGVSNIPTALSFQTSTASTTAEAMRLASNGSATLNGATTITYTGPSPALTVDYEYVQTLSVDASWGPMGQPAMIVSNDKQNCIIGYLYANNAPGTAAFPSAVNGYSKLPVGSQGNYSCGVYGLGELYASSGSTFAMEATVRNNSTVNADINLPPDQSFGTTKVVTSGIQVASGGNHDSSIGVRIGLESGSSAQFSCGQYIQNFRNFGLVIDAQPSGNQNNIYSKSNGNAVQLVLQTTSAAQPANLVLNVLDSGGASHFSVTQGGTVSATTFAGALTGHASLDLPLTGGTLTGNLVIAPAAGTASLVVNGVTAGNQVFAQFMDAGTTTHYLGKQNNNTFFLFDAIHSRNLFYSTTAGDLTLQPDAGGVVVGAPTGGAKGAGTLNAQGVYANNVLLTSSVEFKTDIQPLSDGLAAVAAISPVSFRWREPPPPEQGLHPLDEDVVEVAQSPPDFLTKLNRGFIAQDVVKILGGADDAIDLGAMVAVLWDAVRELSDKVDELSATPKARSK